LSEADSHRSRLGNAAAAARSEVGGIAIILAAAIGLLGFLAVTDIVAGGASTTLDHGLMAMLHPNGGSQAIGPAWLAQAALDLTALGSITDLCVIAVLASALFASGERWREAVLLIAAPLSGVVILNIFKRVFDRPRPPLALHAVVVGNASFPSGHAMLSAVVYLTLGALLAHFAERARTKGFALVAGMVLTLAIGASRVYLGVHWPTDVIAGWALGAAWAMLWWLLVWFFERRSEGHFS
jgi:undecaprenyl-diphosphatase